MAESMIIGHWNTTNDTFFLKLPLSKKIHLPGEIYALKRPRIAACLSTSPTDMDTEKKPELTNSLSFSEGEKGHTTTANLPTPNAALIQDAIEAIGMGRYQWQLMVSCGFGFVVDQVRADGISTA